MNFAKYKRILFKEIVAEGLEGITFESLLKHVEIICNIKNIDNYKDSLWKIIIELESINFYKLPTPRNCNFRVRKLKEHYNMTNNCFMQSLEPFEQEYLCALVDKDEVFGSCETYSNRVNVDSEIKNKDFSFSVIHIKYGNTLVMVASQQNRMNYLCPLDLTLSKQQYAHLECIGRYRRNGLLISANQCAKFLTKDVKGTWFHRKKLKEKDLITIQKINIMNTVGVINVHHLIHIKLCYRPYFNIFERKIEKLYSHIRDIPCKAVNTNICNQLLNVDVDFLNRAVLTEWIEIITTTYRKLNETCHQPHVLSDDELLSLYIEECCLPKDGDYSTDLLDKSSTFIRRKKSYDDITSKLSDLEKLFGNAKESKSVQDVELPANLIQFNNEDHIQIQILNMLARQSMSIEEIRRSLANTCVKTLIRDMMKKKLIYVSYHSKEKHSSAYYSTYKLINHDQKNVPMLPTIEDTNKGDHQSKQNHRVLDPMIRNPRRQERYKFLLELVKSKLVVPGFYEAQKAIKDWERSKSYLEVMDRKSFRRILADAVENKEIETINVEIDDKNTETWLVLPGMTRESIEFMNHLTIKQEILEKKLKLINIVPVNTIVSTKKSKKKKRKYQHIDDKPKAIVDLLATVKNLDYDSQKLQDFSIPKLPVMVKLKVLHEFIWYILVGYHIESDNSFEPMEDSDDVKVYYSIAGDWRRYVAPLSQDKDDHTMTFTFNDILSRMPLSLFCLIAAPRKCNEALYQHLSDQSLQFQTLGNLIYSSPSMIEYLLNHDEKWCRRKLIDTLESLVNMGALSRLDSKTIFREQVMFSLNKEVFLTNTSNYNLPIVDTEVWRQMSRQQWVLDTKLDIGNYWENVYNVCISTKTKMGYKPPGIGLLSREYCEMMRNADYIKEHVMSNGPLLAEHVEHIRQYGAWLPMDTIQWKEIGAGGFHRMILSWNILNWCHNRFDKACSLLPMSISSGFMPFKMGLFVETDKQRDQKSVATYSVSLNDNLSHILNEVNIILVAVSVIHYDQDIEFFWSKLRKCKWFRPLFPLTAVINLETLKSYESLLTSDHGIERRYLIDLMTNNELIQCFLKKVIAKPSRQEDWIQEVGVIRMLMVQLIKIHKFIPQWDKSSDNDEHIGDLVNEIRLSNIRIRTKFDDNKKPPANIETSKRIIKPDNIDTIDSIVSICLIKYLLGCLHPYEEASSPDIRTRNMVFKSYSIPVIISAVNTFSLSNFYCLEPLKDKKVTMKMIEDNFLDVRFRKLASRFLIDTRRVSHYDVVQSQYHSWSEPPVFDGHRATFTCQFDNLDLKDLLYSFAFLFIKSSHDDKRHNAMEVTLKANNFIFNDKKPKMKTVCHSSVYGVNLKDTRLTDADWSKMTQGTSAKISLDKETYRGLYCVPGRDAVWEKLTRFISLTKEEEEPMTKKLKLSDIELTQEYIDDGEFGGRNYCELKKRFPDRESLNNHLEALVRTEQVYIVGMNSFHFVGKKYLRPWLVKLPSSGTCDDSQTSMTTRKRTRSFSKAHEKQYFSPEFYLDEKAQFKCVTFKEIVSKIYIEALKLCGGTLAALTDDISAFLGANVVRKLINILSEYKVLKLVTLKPSHKGGLFRPPVTYSEVEYDQYDDDNGRLTTVSVCALGHLSMDNLIRDMSQYFCVDLKKSVCVETSPMDEDEEEENYYDGDNKYNIEDRTSHA